jgi:hypothetical protein
MALSDLRIYPLLALCLGALACSESGDSSSSPADSGALVAEEDSAVECELTGDYEVILTMRSGNCGPAQVSRITIPEAEVLTHTEMRFDVEVVTTTVLKGCSVRLTQEMVSRQGLLVSQLSASDLQLVSEGTLQGQAQLTRFQDNAVICEGLYEMSMHMVP